MKRVRGILAVWLCLWFALSGVPALAMPCADAPPGSPAAVGRSDHCHDAAPAHAASPRKHVPSGHPAAPACKHCAACDLAGASTPTAQVVLTLPPPVRDYAAAPALDPPTHLPEPGHPPPRV